MPSERFLTFWQNSFIKKSVEESKNKKRVKNVITKQVSYEGLSSIR